MGFEKSDNIGFFSNPIILCNKKFCWNSLLHKKVLRARKRSSLREIYSCAIRERAKVCVKRTLCYILCWIILCSKNGKKNVLLYYFRNANEKVVCIMALLMRFY